jgi:hypothetical protein
MDRISDQDPDLVIFNFYFAAPETQQFSSSEEYDGESQSVLGKEKQLFRYKLRFP